MKRINQGIYYNIVYLNNKEKDIIESAKKLDIDKIYMLGDKRFRVISEVKFKLTLEDIDNIRVMMEDYDEGTIQNKLCIRMYKAFNNGIPNVRFSNEEKEIMSYMYYESNMLSDSDRKTLSKVLNIK